MAKKRINIKSKEEFEEYAESKDDIDRILIKFKDPKIKHTKKYIIVERDHIDYAKEKTEDTGIGIRTKDMKIVKRCRISKSY